MHRLAVALGIGLIVGLERGWSARGEQSGERQAGLRTFTLAALLGGVLAAASLPDRFEVLAAGVLGLGALVTGGYVLMSRQTRDFGMTTELALIATFGLGALAVLGAPFEAAAAAMVMTLVLGFKAEFHALLQKIARDELLATLQLVAIAVVLVPLLPNRNMGPWEAVNPRVIGVLVLLIAGLSYVGYVAVRVFGERLGLLLTALLGGLSSSTAVTVAYARRARDTLANRPLLGVGIALSAAAMVPRLAIEVAAVNAPLLRTLWPTFAALAAVPALGALLVLRSKSARDGEVQLRNPLQLGAALSFGALLAALFVVIGGVSRMLGDAGIYVAAALAGFFDVDAVSIALAGNVARGAVDAESAARAIALAVLVNTGVKAVLAAALSARALLPSASLLLAVALAAAGTVAAVTL